MKRAGGARPRCTARRYSVLRAEVSREAGEARGAWKARPAAISRGVCQVSERCGMIA